MIVWLWVVLGCTSLEETCAQGYADLNTRVEDAAVCVDDTDCVAVDGGCGLDCPLAVNADQADALQTDILNLNETCFPGCVSDCASVDRLVCNADSRCEVVNDEG